MNHLQGLSFWNIDPTVANIRCGPGVFGEDNPVDAELIRALLGSEGVPSRILRVETENAFRSALDPDRLDLILSDLSLPTFDGIGMQTETVSEGHALSGLGIVMTLVEQLGGTLRFEADCGTRAIVTFPG